MTDKPDHPPLTIVGLGPGTWESLTIEAVEVMRGAGEVYARTTAHPSLEPISSRLPEVTFHSFDTVYEAGSSFEEIYEEIATAILRLAERPQGVVYAVPGNPSHGETTVRMLLERAGSLPVSIVAGISYVEPTLAAVRRADAGWIEVMDASAIALLSRANALGEVPGEKQPLPWRAPIPTAPLVVSGPFDCEVASDVKRWLGRYYPAEHSVCLVRDAGTALPQTVKIRLGELDQQPDLDHRTTLYVSALPETRNVRTFAGLMELTRRLRAPGGCPWDREQTHASLKPHLLEEAYEVLDALDSGEPELIAEELGDLLFQVAIHSQVAAEAGTFSIEDVIEGIMVKLIGRHPHVFGQLELESAQDVRQHWELFKQREKPKRSSVLEEIPRGLPALPQSNLMQKRAASVGFEWPAVVDGLEKVREEIGELETEITASAPMDVHREEFGDIVFALVSVARHLRIDPEEALRLANRKFAARFQYVESQVRGEGRSLRDLSFRELDALWNEAKAATS